MKTHRVNPMFVEQLRAFAMFVLIVLSAVGACWLVGLL
jgi:hypothetical protein